MNLLHRLEAMIRAGRLPDPQTTRGLLIYAALGLGIGIWWGGLS